MKIMSVILAHPYPNSFNHALFQQAVQVLETNGHRVFSHDLYLEKFDPVLPKSDLAIGSVPAEIKNYVDEMLESDGMIFIHPNWWGQPPAILKGWIDRVFRNGVAYKFEEGDSGGGMPIGLLTGKIGVVFNTSNTAADRERDFFGDPV